MSWERKGLDLLLARFPDARLFSVVRSDPWLTVELDIGTFAIWRATGAVYRDDPELPGAVVDDPFLVPEGSAYDGPVETWP